MKPIYLSMEDSAWPTTEEDCLHYLEQQRWPSGFDCPSCGCTEGKRIAGRRAMRCCACRKQASVTAGTLFHRVRKLRKWFAIIRGLQQGCSAHSLALELKVSYATAWTVEQRFLTMVVRHLPADADEVDVSHLQLVLFRRSAASGIGRDTQGQGKSARVNGQEREEDDEAKKAKGLVKFIVSIFRGVSSKHVQKYVGALWCATDYRRWSLRSMVNAAVSSSPITRHIIARWTVPTMIKMLTAAA
jgi:transposase-like protein